MVCSTCSICMPLGVSIWLFMAHVEHVHILQNIDFMYSRGFNGNFIPVKMNQYFQNVIYWKLKCIDKHCKVLSFLTWHFAARWIVGNAFQSTPDWEQILSVFCNLTWATVLWMGQKKTRRKPWGPACHTKCGMKKIPPCSRAKWVPINVSIWAKYSWVDTKQQINK